MQAYCDIFNKKVIYLTNEFKNLKGENFIR